MRAWTIRPELVYRYYPVLSNHASLRLIALLDRCDAAWLAIRKGRTY